MYISIDTEDEAESSESEEEEDEEEEEEEEEEGKDTISGSRGVKSQTAIRSIQKEHKKFKKLYEAACKRIQVVPISGFFRLHNLHTLDLSHRGTGALGIQAVAEALLVCTYMYKDKYTSTCTMYMYSYILHLHCISEYNINIYIYIY